MSPSPAAPLRKVQGTRVRHSSKHGRGLFAERPSRHGERTGVFAGPRATRTWSRSGRILPRDEITVHHAEDRDEVE